MTVDYWQKRADKFKQDIEHIKHKMDSVEGSELEALRRQRSFLTDELMTCLDAVEKFSSKVS